MRRLCFLTVVALAAPLAASAESYHHARIRHVEEGVSIQRATETGAEEAVANLPFLPGDRVWTDERGRAEFQFAGGALLRLDSGSKLDYVARDEGRDDRVVLRLWSGALILHARDRRDGPFEIETPGGVVSQDGRGVMRVDVQSGETRLSVFEGEADLEGSQPVTVRAGERVYARRGGLEEGPRGFDRAEGDEFAEWDASREEQVAYASNRPVRLPEDVAPYGGELDHHGAWYYETEVGYVWRPYVRTGWQPYSDGRWVWSAFGWTWVPYESWGWAVSHYGRWGFSPALGWYWIPGAAWAPAWVSWAVGGNYVGWCPLGYRDRPVLVYDRFGRGQRGTALSRGVLSAASPWIYLRRGDVTARDLARRRVQLDPASVQQVRVLETAQTRLTRDLTVGEGPAARAVPRGASTRPGMSDTGPEMRGDPMTTIPVGRRRGRPLEGGTSAEVSAPTAAPAGGPVRLGAPETGGVPRGVHPTDVRNGQRRGVPREEGADGAAGVPRRSRAGDGAEAHPTDRPVRQREGASESDRDVLRPVFRSLGRPRSESQDPAQGSGDRSAPPARRGEAESRHDGESRHAPEARPRESAPRESSPPREAPPREAPPHQSSPHESAPRHEAQGQPRRQDPPPPAAARHPRKEQ